jgi:FAD:protein FMN transferase
MRLNRRHAILGLVAATPLAFARSEAATVSRAGTAFGTTVRLTVTAGTEAKANDALDAGFAEIRAIGKAFNLFDPASEVSRLNATGILRNPSSLMREMLTITDVVWTDTEGAFDPTVQPLWQAWKQANGAPLSEAHLDKIRRAMGWQHVHHDNTSIHFAKSNMALTFNGIAQGYAADRVAAALRHHNVAAALIDTGETGVVPDWGSITFAVRDPRDTNKTVATIDVSDGFVATSGDYASSFTSDFSAHHIFDPRTAHSPNELSSVTVQANRGAEADAYATAMLVAGSEKAIVMARQNGLNIRVVGKDGRMLKSDCRNKSKL